ncbi:capsular polysaccharide biosynthesis protein [Aquicoccus sp. SCR17]|nr:capsular polysaccharide biosynthesis protein [Carideicomes alvinocaridis]
MESASDHDRKAAGTRRLFVYNGGFLAQSRVRRILQLSGYDIRLGLPSSDDLVGLWGASPTAWRGEAVAARRGAGLLRVEDAFLRSLHPGRSRKEPPLGLLLDRGGLHFDAAQPSDLETLLATHPLDDTALMDRARDAIERLRAAHLTKYFAIPDEVAPPAPGYVLVIDQTRGDAAVRASIPGGDAAEAARFREMLVFAREEHPGMPVVIKTHPETVAGHRPGYFGEGDVAQGVTLWDAPVSPWRLFEGAVGVYTVSSQMGFEAIFAGHRPRVFGQPFYAGWGLTQDEVEVPRRTRRLSRAQLFAAAMILYPRWYDPYRDRLCELEQAIDAAEAQARAWREDRHGWIAGGMRLWKRRHVQQMFGAERAVVFENDAGKARNRAARDGRRVMAWASAAGDWRDAVRVEDGFLRSRGLGAELVPPLSLALDDLGIYYDPSRESRLERLLNAAPDLPAHALARAQRLHRALVARGVTKYNTGGALPALPEGHRILVPGQVEDDASITRGGGEVRRNLELLRAAREANPEAVILYKPHPDVLAGLRPGAVPETEAAELADMVLGEADPGALLGQVAEVWTMTSALGFEALLRGVKVVTLGAPFYGGWGLTEDRGPVPERRRARLSLDALVHATLIAYPRYLDPVTGLPCPPELVVERLAEGRVAHPGAANRVLSKMQGLLAAQSWIWRR